MQSIHLHKKRKAKKGFHPIDLFADIAAIRTGVLGLTIY